MKVWIAFFSLVSVAAVITPAYGNILKKCDGDCMDVGGKKYQVSTHVLEPKGKKKGDVFYYPGFGDCYANQKERLEQLRDQGYRVITFDYPCHGDSACSPMDKASFGPSGAAAVAKEVAAKFNAGQGTPLHTVCWSTGCRIASESALPGQTKEASKCIQLAPAYNPKLLVGKGGFLTKESLSDSPEQVTKCLQGAQTPMFTGFAPKLGKAAIKGTDRPVNPNCKNYMFGASAEDDKYVDTEKNWEHYAGQSYDGGVSCGSSKHDLMANSNAKRAVLRILGGGFKPSDVSGDCAYVGSKSLPGQAGGEPKKGRD